MEPDDRVEDYLGRVLDAEGAPAGTCFQVGDRLVATAWHVVDDLGARTDDDVVALDRLRGGPVIEGRVVGADERHDLALLLVSSNLSDSPPALGSSDGMTLRDPVVITGAPHVEDSYTYLFLDAGGEWAGNVQRGDNVRMARVTSNSVLRGMSGAPVISQSDNTVVGVVSGRYHSADGWLEHSVWVARAEDLQALITGLDAAAVQRPAAVTLRNPPSRPWCLVVEAERESGESLSLTDRVSDVIERFMGKAPVFDVIHEEPVRLSVVDAVRSPEDWEVAVRAVAKADYLVADVSGFQPAVMMLLGVRSVLRRGVTITVVRESDRDADDDMPFNVQETRILAYDTNDFFAALGRMMREGAEVLRRDSGYLDLPAYHAVRCAKPTQLTEELGETVLMLCPFRPEYSGFYPDLREVVMSNTRDRRPVRMLDLQSPRLVGQALYEQIRWAAFCIVDWTYWRANVFFEFGVRLACSGLDPMCIFDESSTRADPPASADHPQLLQHGMLQELFRPSRYTRETVYHDLRNSFREWRAGTIDATWTASGAALPSHSTHTVATESFVWQEDPHLVVPHLLHRQMIEDIVGTDPERDPERLTLFSASSDFDSALQAAVREHWISAWLYLRHLAQASVDGATYPAELRNVARRAQHALAPSTDPRHERVVREIGEFLAADRAARRRQRSGGASDGSR